MVYITSIPIIKRRPVYTHQNGNINPTSYTSKRLAVETAKDRPERKTLSVSQIHIERISADSLRGALV